MFLRICLFRKLCRDGIINYVVIYDYLSFSIFSRFIPVVACIRSSFLLLLHNILLNGSTIFLSFIHQLMDMPFVSTLWSLGIMHYEYWCTIFYVDIQFHFYWVHIYPRLFEKHQAVFQSIPTLHVTHSRVGAFWFLHLLMHTCYYLPFWLQPFSRVWKDTSVAFLWG